MSKAVEYEHEGQTWTIDDPESFAARIGKVPASHLPAVHRMLAADSTLWTLLRLLFGWGPVMMSQRTEEYRRLWKIEEIAVHYETDADNLEMLLDSIKGKVQAFLENHPDTPEPREIPTPAETTPATPTRSDLTEAQIALLHRLGFSLQMFSLPGRSSEVEQVEIAWFISRLEEWERLFLEPMVKTLVRQTLMNELQLRRIDDEMVLMTPTGDKYWKSQEKKSKLEAVYQRQLGDLEKLCPNFKATAAKVQIKGVFSEVVEAYLRYKRDRKNDVVDGLFTALELQCMMRDAEEHGVRYRPSISMMVIEARAHLWDPKWAYKFPNELLALMDAGFREGFEKLQEKAGLKKVRLLDDGPAGEYPPIFIPPADAEPKEDREIIIPEVPIEIGEPPADDKRRHKG
jgi:hypothetical protein